jgi:hypothetical protein
MSNSAKSMYFGENKDERNEKNPVFFDLFGGPFGPLPIIFETKAGSIPGYSA